MDQQWSILIIDKSWYPPSGLDAWGCHENPGPLLPGLELVKLLSANPGGLVPTIPFASMPYLPV